MSKDLANVKRNAQAVRKQLVRSIGIIDDFLRSFENIPNLIHCPKCFTRDLRVMKNKEIFCRSCGYDSREDKK